MTGRGTPTPANAVIVVACLWLFVSSWVLNYGGNAGWTSTVVAAVIAALAVIRVAWLRWVDWFNVVLAIWLAIAPWVLGYDDEAARWNSVIVGLVVGLLALWSASAGRRGTPAA